MPAYEWKSPKRSQHQRKRQLVLFGQSPLYFEITIHHEEVMIYICCSYRYSSIPSDSFCYYQGKVIEKNEIFLNPALFGLE